MLLRLLSVFILSFSSFAGDDWAFKVTDSSIDKLDGILPYSRLYSVIKREKTPRPFSTDGCSGEISKTWDTVIFPKYIQPKLPPGDRDRVIPFPAQDCCFAHDRNYHSAKLLTLLGSTPQRLRKSRKLADQRMRSCIKKNSKKDFIDSLALMMLPADYSMEDLNEKREELNKKLDIDKIADMMYFGVRLGGMPCSRQEYRFGYGYSKCF